VVLSFLTRVNVVTLLATRGLQVPVVISERNNPLRQGIGRTWTFVRDQLYPLASRLVVMTKRASEYFPQGRPLVTVIPNPVVLPDGWRERRGGHRLVAVGRLVEQKGFDLLLEAFARVAPEFPQWTLVIWGEGQLRRSLEAHRDHLGLNGRVQMPGVTARPGIWVEDADVFVLSSRYEGWGIVLSEAMAAGLPVVSFDCPFGPAEMVVHEADGLLVPAEDVDALALAFRRVLSDASLRSRLATAARESARRFSPEAVMAAWDSVIDETYRADTKRLRSPEARSDRPRSTVSTS
jgi:glycosyltransferase involved in cell wall biosynthesis